MMTSSTMIAAAVLAFHPSPARRDHEKIWVGSDVY